MIATDPQPLRLELNLTASPQLLECLRMLISTTMTANGSEFMQRHASWPLFPAQPAISPPPPPPPPPQNSTASLTFSDAFETHVRPTLQIEDKTSTISGYRTAVKDFSEWFARHITRPATEPNSPAENSARRSLGPTVIELETQPTLLADFYVYSLKNSAPKTAANKLKNLKTIWRRLHTEQHIKRPVPEPRTKLIRKQQKIETFKTLPIPASNEEIDRLLTSAVELADQLTWPNCGIGSLEPWQFWWNVIAVLTVHGFRPGDIWPREAKHGNGLLWSEVFTSHSPPITGGESERLQADWQFGWIAKRTNKTGETLIAPMSPHLRFLVEACRGQDKNRVFPIPYNGKYFDREFGKIRTRAALPHVSLCDGAPSASLRKTASVLWRRSASLAASSHMLCHAVDLQEERSSNVTETHYAGADILRQIVAAYPALLASLPSLLRC